MATDIERLTVVLEANIKKYEKEMARTRQVTDRSMKAVERSAQSSMKRLEGIMGSGGARMQAALAGVFAGLSVRKVAEFADSYTKVQNSLKVAGLEGEKLKGTYDQLFAVAQKQGAPIEAMATLYGRLSMAQKELNATAPELMRFTEGVATALRVAGTDSAAASGALLQLSQAMGGGVVRAEEYNSILEGARPVLQAVAAGMVEAEGSVAKLTTMVKDGQVSSEAFFRAFEAGLPVLEDMASKAVPTLGQSLERVYNALTDTAGKMAEATNATTGFQSAIDLLIADIGKIPNDLAASIHELERFIQLFGQAKAFVDRGLDVVFGGKPANRIDQAFDADSYAVHGSMRGYKPPASASAPPAVAPIRNSDYAVPDDGKAGKKGRSSRERINEYEREIETIGKRTRALDAEREVVGKSAGDTAKAEASFRLLEAAKKANVAITPQILADIDAMATKYGEATEAIEAAREAQEAVADAMSEVGAMLSDAFTDAILEGEKLDDVLKKLLKSLASKGIDSIFQSLFSGGSGGGGLGGLLGNLFSPGKASGGPVKAGQPYTVGESGRETFVPTQPGRIIPHGRGGGGVQVQIINNNGSQVSQRTTNGPKGPTIQVQIENAVAGVIANGGLDKALKGRFGVSPMGGK